MYKENKFLLFCLIGFISCLILATLLLASVPPVDRDALTHHLFVPKLWLKHGGIHEIPEIPFSYYPMNLDLLYAIPLYFGNDIIPKYIHYCFALLTALLLYRHLTARLNRKYGLLGAFFFLSIPIIVKLSITVYVDLGLVFFTTAALLLLLHWAEQNFQPRFLVLAGVCCGLAAGTKYNGLIAVVVLTSFVPMLYQQSVAKERQSNGNALLWGGIFIIATLTTSAPWLIRNYLWTGNPIYPLHNSFFQKLAPTTQDRYPSPRDSTGIPQETADPGGNAFVARKNLYNETWWQALLLPLRFFYEGQDDNPQFFDGKLSPFLLFLPLTVLFFKPSSEQWRREQRYLFFFALLYFFLTFFQQVMRVRYIVPIVPPLVILSMYGLHGLIHFQPARLSSNTLHKTAMLSLAAGLIVSALWYNLHYFVSQFALVQPLPYLRGTLSREEYIATFRPEYRVIQHANSTLSPEIKVLCLFLGNRGYYMDFQPVFEQPHSVGLFSRFLASNNNEANITAVMAQKNITHVLIREDLTVSWLRRLNDGDRLRVAPLFANASQPLARQAGFSFFQISSEPAPKKNL